MDARRDALGGREGGPGLETSNRSAPPRTGEGVGSRGQVM